MTRRLTLVGADGSYLDLNKASGNYLAGRDVSLFGGPPVELTERDILQRPGSLVTKVRHLAREVILPVLVMGESSGELDAALQALMVATDPARGEVRVIVERDDGTERELSAYLIGGHEALAYPMANSSQVVVPLRLRAVDPYWREVREYERSIKIQTFEDDIGEGVGTASDAEISSDANIPSDGFDLTGLNYFHVDLEGDVETWPRWEIYGPGGLFTAVNLTTGKLWSFERTLANRAYLQVYTQPGNRMVAVNHVDWFASLSSDSELWSLVPGRNWIGIRFQDTTFGTSEAWMRWNERYLTC